MDAAVGSFNIGTAAAGNTVSVTTLPFQPKVVIFFWNTRTEATDAGGGSHFQRGMGWMVGSTQRGACTSQSTDAATTSANDRAIYNDACIASLTTAGAIDGKADFDAFLANGFRVIIDDQFATDHRVGYLALGGADLTDVAAGDFETINGTGDQDITSVGFEPTSVLLMNRAGGSGTINTSIVTASFMLGAAAGATPVNAVYTGTSIDNQPTMVTRHYCRMGECFAFVAGAAAVVARASVSAWLSNGFRLAWTEATGAPSPTVYLALRGPKVFIGDLLTQTNTSTPIAESGFGFQPKAVLLASACAAENASDTAAAQDIWSIGAFTSATSRMALAGADVDGLADAACSSYIEHDACYARPGASDALVGLMDVQSIDSDGFTLIMDDADPAQAFAWYLAFGDGDAVIGNDAKIIIRPSA